MSAIATVTAMAEATALRLYADASRRENRTLGSGAV